MKKLVITGITLFFLIAAEAQYPCSVTKGVAFYRIVMPGNIAVGPNGKARQIPVNKERFIYLLCSCKIKPVIKTIMYGALPVSAAVSEETEKTVTAGIESSGKPIILSAPAGYFYRRIDISKTDSLPPEKRPGKIFISGIMAKQKVQPVHFCRK